MAKIELDKIQYMQEWSWISHGNYMSQTFPLPHFVKESEALATRRALTFYLKVYIANAVFEGDSQIIMKSLSNC